MSAHTPFGFRPFLDASHVAIDKASGVVRDRMVSGFSRYLMVEVSKLVLCLCLDSFLCSYQPTVTLRAVLFLSLDPLIALGWEPLGG